MEINKIRLILFLCLCKSIFSAECSTAVDCYTKAVGVLNEDRSEIRRQLDKYKELYDGVVKENDKLKLSIDSLEINFNKNLENIKKDFQEKLDQITHYIDRPWTLVNKKVYDSNSLSTNLLAIPLNSNVPPMAKKLLIYVSFSTGSGYRAEGNINVFTKVNGLISRRSLLLSTYNQNAIDTNSSVFEMDLDGVDLNLYYSSDVNYTGNNFAFHIEILGYK